MGPQMSLVRLHLDLLLLIVLKGISLSCWKDTLLQPKWYFQIQFMVFWNIIYFSCLGELILPSEPSFKSLPFRNSHRCYCSSIFVEWRFRFRSRCWTRSRSFFKCSRGTRFIILILCFWAVWVVCSFRKSYAWKIIALNNFCSGNRFPTLHSWWRTARKDGDYYRTGLLSWRSLRNSDRKLLRGFRKINSFIHFQSFTASFYFCLFFILCF